MGEKNLRKKIKYPQPHNIHVRTGNEALDAKMREHLHGKLKHEAKYNKSKFTKRLPNYFLED